MIDTVILSINRDQVKILTESGRLGTHWELTGKTAMYEKWVRNPKRAHKDTGNYYPRITGYRRNQASESMRIEFSAPKLIFGNNLDELCDEDFPKVIRALVSRLYELGVIVKAEIIENAEVIGFHPSKNFPLTDGYTSGFVVRELSKINLGKRFDLNKADFRNSGQSLQGYTASHSIVFYDKMADLAKPEKRAIDKDQTMSQLSLFQQIKNESPDLEILRLEIRLSQKQKMRSVLKKLGMKERVTFRDIFSSNLCKQIVTDYWETIVADKNLFLFDLASSPKQVLKNALSNGSKSKEAVYLVGLSVLSQAEGGMRELRSVIEKKSGSRGWYRIAEGFKTLNAEIAPKQCHSWVQQINTGLAKFSPFKYEQSKNL